MPQHVKDGTKLSGLRRRGTLQHGLIFTLPFVGGIGDEPHPRVRLETDAPKATSCGHDCLAAVIQAAAARSAVRVSVTRPSCRVQKALTVGKGSRLGSAGHPELHEDAGHVGTLAVLGEMNNSSAICSLLWPWTSTLRTSDSRAVSPYDEMPLG